MPYKDPEKQKKAQAEWYQKNKKKCDKRTRKWKQKNRAKLREYKKKEVPRNQLARIRLIEYKGGKCEGCGFKYTEPFGRLFDFHHKDPKYKKFELSGSALSRKWSSVKEEADKCQLLCAMCHRLAHYEQDILNHVTIKRRK